MYCWEKNWIL